MLTQSLNAKLPHVTDKHSGCFNWSQVWTWNTKKCKVLRVKKSFSLLMLMAVRKLQIKA